MTLLKKKKEENVYIDSVVKIENCKCYIKYKRCLIELERLKMPFETMNVFLEKPYIPLRNGSFGGHMTCQ